MSGRPKGPGSRTARGTARGTASRTTTRVIEYPVPESTHPAFRREAFILNANHMAGGLNRMVRNAKRHPGSAQAFKKGTFYDTVRYMPGSERWAITHNGDEIKRGDLVYMFDIDDVLRTLHIKSSDKALDAFISSFGRPYMFIAIVNEEPSGDEKSDMPIMIRPLIKPKKQCKEKSGSCTIMRKTRKARKSLRKSRRASRRAH